METLALNTEGRRFYPGFSLPLVHSSWPALQAASPEEPRLALCLIEAGSVTLRPCGYRISAPSLIVLDPWARPDWQAGEGLRCASLYFHPRAVNSAFTCFPVSIEGDEVLSLSSAQDLYLFEPFQGQDGKAWALPLNPVYFERFRSGFSRIAGLLEDQPHDKWPCLVRSFLIEMLFTLRLAVQENVGLEARDPRLQRALRLIHEHFHEPLSLEGLARLCATNRTTLNSLLRERTGLSMRAYLVQLRLKMAESLLRDTQLPVGQIANRVGYEDTSHFIRLFRRSLGQTPSAYRHSAPR